MVEAETSLPPLMLQRTVQRVQREMGRKRVVKGGPRNIDIDILLHEQVRMNTAKPEIPHPRMRERRFVLEPLVELAAELRDPVSGRTMRELLEGVKGQVARRV